MAVAGFHYRAFSSFWMSGRIRTRTKHTPGVMPCASLRSSSTNPDAATVLSSTHIETSIMMTAQESAKCIVTYKVIGLGKR